MGRTRSTHAGHKEPIKTSVAKLDGVKPRRIRERSCKNNIEFDLKKMGFQSVGWIYLVQEMCSGNAVIKLQVP